MKFTTFPRFLATTLGLIFSVYANAQSNINFGPPTGQATGGGRFGHPAGQRVNGIYFGPPAGRIEAVRVNGSTDVYSRMGNGSLYNAKTGEVLSASYLNGQLMGYSGNRGTRFVRRSDGAFGSPGGLTIPSEEATASNPIRFDSDRTYSSIGVRTPSQRVYSTVAAPVQAGVETVGRLLPNTIYTVSKTNGPWVSLKDSNNLILPGWVRAQYLRVYL